MISVPSTEKLSPNGMATNTTKGGTMARIGASLNRKRSASAGMWSSLVRSLIPSATGCSNPCHPTRIGPSRCWMWPAIFRSSHTSGNGSSKSIAIRKATFAAIRPMAMTGSMIDCRWLSDVSGVVRGIWPSR